VTPYINSDRFGAPSQGQRPLTPTAGTPGEGAQAGAFRSYWATDWAPYLIIKSWGEPCAAGETAGALKSENVPLKRCYYVDQQPGPSYIDLQPGRGQTLKKVRDLRAFLRWRQRMRTAEPLRRIGSAQKLVLARTVLPKIHTVGESGSGGLFPKACLAAWLAMLSKPISPAPCKDRGVGSGITENGQPRFGEQNPETAPLPGPGPGPSIPRQMLLVSYWPRRPNRWPATPQRGKKNQAKAGYRSWF